MTEHPSTQILEQYAGRTLSPDVFLEVHEHVTSCPVCSKLESFTAQQADYANLWSAMMPSPTDEPYHLSAAELSAYAHNDLAEIDRENAESHLEVCDQCREKAKEAERALTPAQTKIASTVGWWNFTRAGLLHSRPVQLAALILLALVIGAFALAVWLGRKQHQPLQAPVQNVNGPLRAEDQPNAASPEVGAQRDAATETVLQLNDGGRLIVLKKQGDLQGAEYLPAGLQQAIKTTLITGQLEKPKDLRELEGQQSTLLGGSDDGTPFQLLAPVGRVVADNQPIFRWRPLEGAASYTVAIIDKNLDEVLTSPPLTVSEWKSPRKLKAGVYSWQVTAIKDGRRVVSPTLPAPQTKFKVLESKKIEEIARARRDFSESHLALGVLFSRVGLLDEARHEFELLLNANPRSALVKKLLDQLQTKR